MKKERSMKALAAAMCGLFIGTAAMIAGAQPVNMQADPSVLQVVQREERRRAEQEGQRRLERARQNCEANRGTDCGTAEGLREWLLLERSRAEAVLDRVLPPPDQATR